MSHVFYTSRKRHIFDEFIYPVSLIAPIMTIPQLLSIWLQKSTQGISILTWSAYALVSLLWIIYGVIHKEKPIIVSNFLLFILDTSIVIGVLLYS
ncbi:MAG TPA: SemiSWEET family transporter [Patescibacteria group bacterium]|nr:SemiSWEET family transporter [Patescibacteria group bacterium]